jgi:hypothetical protein
VTEVAYLLMIWRYLGWKSWKDSITLLTGTVASGSIMEKRVKKIIQRAVLFEVLQDRHPRKNVNRSHGCRDDEEKKSREGSRSGSVEDDIDFGAEKSLPSPLKLMGEEENDSTEKWHEVRLYLSN